MAVFFNLIANCLQYRHTLWGRIMEFSVYGTIWLTLLFLVGHFIGKKSGVLWQYLVCVCIALHLLVPVHIPWFSVEVPFFQEIMQETDRGVVQKKEELENKKNVEGVSDGVETASSYKEVLADYEASYRQVQKSVLGEGEKIDIPSSEKWTTGEKRGQPSHFLIMAEIVWLLGMLFFFGETGISYFAFCRQANRWGLPVSPMSLQICEQVKKQYGIHRDFRLLRSNKVTSPMLYGVFKPVILLPNQEYSSQEYQYIFRHELTHYRHRDVWMKCLFTACRGVYWFHPLVHWMYFRVCLQMELLCDEAVVGKKDIEEKRAYGMVLLRHMSSFSGKVPLSAGFYGGKKYMKMRFKNIMNVTKRKIGLSAFIAAAFFALVLGGVKWNASAEGNKIAKESQKKNSAAEKEEISDQTIAVIGIDEWKFADAIFLLHVGTGNKEVSIENVPRELLVKADDFSAVMTEERKERYKGVSVKAQKLSSISATYDYEILKDVLGRLYDVTIDSYIVLDYEMVRKMIDTVGGVEVTLTKKEADYLNHTNFISKKENRTVKAGKQMLNGDQAMGYLRVRKPQAGGAVVDGKESKKQDIFARGDRCNNVLLGLVQQVKNRKSDWKKLVQLLVKEKGIQKAEIPLDELILLAGKVVSGDFDVVISEERAYGTYVADFDEDDIAVGSVLRLEK